MNEHPLREPPTCAEFAAVREERERFLPMPRLILHALQNSIRAGRLLEIKGGGQRLLKYPLDTLVGAAWA